MADRGARQVWPGDDGQSRSLAPGAERSAVAHGSLRSCLMIGGEATAEWVDALREAGFDTVAVKGFEAGRKGLEALRPDVVLLDLTLDHGAGMALMRDSLRRSRDTRFVVISDDGSVNHAVEAMRGGASEFLVKPFGAPRLIAAVEASLSPQSDGHFHGNEHLHAPPAGSGLIGSSAAMGEVYAKIRSVSRSLATVFVHGESGTGKELCAQAIHRLSPRSDGPFVPVACAALPEPSAEAEIFGVAGSEAGEGYLGAVRQADGGTLFLDEICEMSLGLQAKMLRYLQTATIQPLGSSRPERVKTRIICATSRDPMEEVRAGRFRRDLYYRLHVVPLMLPPLREREDDVIEIAHSALREFAAEEGSGFTELSDAAADRLRAYSWPGNVRELRNLLRRIVILHAGARIEAAMLPPEVVATGEDTPGGDATDGRLGRLIGRSLAEIEQIVIEETIRKSGGSVPRAARMLKVSPSTIYRKREAWRLHGQNGH